MSQETPRELSRKAAAWMATCFVLAGGVVTCVALSLTFWDDPKKPLAATAAGTAFILLMLWLLRDRPRGEHSPGLMAWILGRQQSLEQKVAFRLSRRRGPAPPMELGRNEPPTVERVRDLREGIHNWKPSDRHVQER